MSRFKNIPDGWVETNLDNVSIKVTDGSHQSPKSVQEGMPMLSVKDMNEFGFDIKNSKKISTRDYDLLVKQGCKPNVDDILIAKDGSVLKHIFRVKEQLNAVLLSSIAIISPNIKKIDPRYLVYILANPNFKKYILNNFLSGSGVPRIVLKDFKKIKFIIPKNINEQNSIASILTAFDDKIELLQVQNKTLETIAQTIFSEWFGKKNNNWEFAKINNLLEITSSKRIFYDEYATSGVPFYRSKEIIELSKKTSISTELFITENRFKQIKENFDVPKKGDILLSAVGTIGIPFQVRNHNNFYFKDGNLVWFKNFNKELSSDYVYNWLKLKTTQDILKMISIGSTQKALTISSLKELEIPIITNPKKREEFYKFLKSNLDKVNHNQLQIETLILTRDQLLPKLISGEIRVNNI